MFLLVSETGRLSHNHMTPGAGACNTHQQISPGPCWHVIQLLSLSLCSCSAVGPGGCKRPLGTEAKFILFLFLNLFSSGVGDARKRIRSSSTREQLMRNSSPASRTESRPSWRERGSSASLLHGKCKTGRCTGPFPSLPPSPSTPLLLLASSQISRPGIIHDAGHGLEAFSSSASPALSCPS